MPTNWVEAQAKSVKTGRWAVTLTKVRIRRVASRTRWQFVTFCGPSGAESRGIVDLLAIRKDHGAPPDGLKRGDRFQIVIIQVKGGRAASPTPEDAQRLRAAARRLGAKCILLASWKKGQQVRFYRLRPNTRSLTQQWTEVSDLSPIFG